MNKFTKDLIADILFNRSLLNSSKSSQYIKYLLSNNPIFLIILLLTNKMHAIEKLIHTSPVIGFVDNSF